MPGDAVDEFPGFRLQSDCSGEQLLSSVEAEAAALYPARSGANCSAAVAGQEPAYSKVQNKRYGPKFEYGLGPIT